MPENTKDVVYLFFVIPIFGVFAHIVALVALSPILYFFWSPNSKSSRFLALFAGTPVVWSMLFYGSYIGGQFFQSLSTIGLLLAAVISTAMMSWGSGKSWFDKRKWIAIFMLLFFPAIGYIVGLGLS